ncbi:hypothetical protein [Campylobacter gastrosuis]|uniref:Lipoprotein n=1 Tax=Campylobacter gastrosuis TaxID=2974576 RepID=A0ABT7HPN6_9BACT|nr:hypothetical protein [Campylobacter gastrosuis]MDL0088780.1 hypothetical protein [Campylobacter gastrosuis]
MKKILTLVALFGLNCAFADTYVNGYFKKDGTYVQPHYKSSRDSTTINNYSTKGNYNPYTGKQGTKKPNW